MLYQLIQYLDGLWNIPGARLFQYISFRASMAMLSSLLIALVFGKKIIGFIRKKQLGETIRNLGLQGQKEKEGTPTMGGIIIILAIIVPSLLFTKLDNVYIQLLLFSTLWMGFIGFIDDYIKVFRKNKEGLRGTFKIMGQFGLGVIVGLVMYFHPDIIIREKTNLNSISESNRMKEKGPKSNMMDKKDVESKEQVINSPFGKEEKFMRTTIPFIKNNEIDYDKLAGYLLPDAFKDYYFLFYVLVVVFIITAVSNGANLTDGIDGLAAGSAAIISSTLALFAWVSGNILFADYLNIMHIPNVGEMVVFSAAFVGALVGFLWYNTYPAQVFMGDTGSLTIGGVIAVLAIAERKELLIPIMCGIFLIESLSVILQVFYFKYTKRRYGQGKRIFRMSPLHHHFQLLGYHESKIAVRFLIIGVALALLSVITLKIR